LLSPFQLIEVCGDAVQEVVHLGCYFVEEGGLRGLESGFGDEFKVLVAQWSAASENKRSETYPCCL
jgi:hypothetical protein